MDKFWSEYWHNIRGPVIALGITALTLAVASEIITYYVQRRFDENKRIEERAYNALHNIPQVHNLDSLHDLAIKHLDDRINMYTRQKDSINTEYARALDSLKRIYEVR